MNGKVIGSVIAVIVFGILGGYFVAFRPFPHPLIIGGVFLVIALASAFVAFWGSRKTMPKTA